MSDLYLEPKERAALLRKAAHAILEQPADTFAMRHFAKGKIRKQDNALVFDCDSACCLAGETAALHPHVKQLTGANGILGGDRLIFTDNTSMGFRRGMEAMGYTVAINGEAAPLWNPASEFWYEVTGTPQDDEHLSEWNDLVSLPDATIRDHLLAGVERYITEQGWEKGEGDAAQD